MLDKESGDIINFEISEETNVRTKNIALASAGIMELVDRRRRQDSLRYKCICVRKNVCIY